MLKRARTVLTSLAACVMLLISGTVYYDQGAATDTAKTSNGATPNLIPSAIPEFTWETATPESQGLYPDKLDSMWSTLRARNTVAFLVIRNDRIAYERYVSSSRNQKHYTASMAKGLVGGISLMVAMTDGLISPDNLVQLYVPQWATDPIKSKITVRDLATHTSGLEEAGEGNRPKDQLTGWKGDFWNRLATPNDPFTISRDAVPVISPPGTVSSYSNPGIAMLGYVVTVSLKGTADRDIRSLLRNRIMNPIGVPSAEWECGYGETYTVDGLPLLPTWGGGRYSPDAAARVARLLLRRGDWDGNRLLSPTVVQASTTSPIPGVPGNGLFGWWGIVDDHGDRMSPSLPRDAFYAIGAGHQVVLVIPSLNLIALRYGELLDSGNFERALEKYFFAPLMATVVRPKATKPRANSVTTTVMGVGIAPYPASPTIKGIAWAPISEIIRRAQGSDNWPLTWTDDNTLFTAYGDGYGFDPKVPEKLSLGFAVISGAPPAFSGVNLRSPTGEQKGERETGKKASGMLMVDGVLYMWVRNAGNSHLAWSSDHGKSWTWSAWKFTTSFGFPAFLNFGRNYEGARDEYVYVYSHDNGSAYDPADRMVLARVPKGALKNRNAYEFFHGLDARGDPAWTRDISRRQAVFIHRKKCYRSAISYHPKLKRYLWTQTLPGGDRVSGGGFGIYDAPEPWGPWTTVYFTEQWDVPPGEMSSFPTKWMGDDGKTLYLVFSGNDSFSLRKATLTLAEE
jgi:CubicO group peptidase (beta-lactamase class C family)